MDTKQVVFPDGLITICYSSACSLGSVHSITGGAPFSAVWPAANRALVYPFRISKPITATLMWVYNGAVVNGNFDIGIYDCSGRRIVSSGSTAQAGISSIQTVDIADTKFGPGLFYIALVLDNIVGKIMFTTLGPSYYAVRLLGAAQMAAAFVLPAIFVFAGLAVGWSEIPSCGLTTRGVV